MSYAIKVARFALKQEFKPLIMTSHPVTIIACTEIVSFLFHISDRMKKLVQEKNNVHDRPQSEFINH